MRRSHLGRQNMHRLATQDCKYKCCRGMEGWHWQDFKTLGLQVSTVRARVSHQASEYIFAFVPWEDAQLTRFPRCSKKTTLSLWNRRQEGRTQNPDALLGFWHSWCIQTATDTDQQFASTKCTGYLKWRTYSKLQRSSTLPFHGIWLDTFWLEHKSIRFSSLLPLEEGFEVCRFREPTWRRYSPPKLSAKPGRCRWIHCHIATIVPWRYTSPTHIVVDPKDLAEGLGYGIAGFEATRWKRFRMWIYNDL